MSTNNQDELIQWLGWDLPARADLSDNTPLRHNAYNSQSAPYQPQVWPLPAPSDECKSSPADLYVVMIKSSACYIDIYWFWQSLLAHHSGIMLINLFILCTCMGRHHCQKVNPLSTTGLSHSFFFWSVNYMITACKIFTMLQCFSNNSLLC